MSNRVTTERWSCHKMNVTRYSILITSVVSVLFLTTLADATNDLGLWPEIGIKLKQKNRNLKGNTQVRFRDNIKDLHYFRAEFGPGFTLSLLEFFIMYRFNPQERNSTWNTQHYLLVDPTVKKIKLLSSSNLLLDLRSRLQIKLGDNGRSFLRVRPHLYHKMRSQNIDSWFINNEFFIQISDLGQRSRVNQNRFSVGLKLKRGNIDFSPYYLLRSDKPTSSAPWNHIHVIGVSAYMNN